MQQMVVVATLPEFKAWHVKHQSSCPWLTQARVAILQLVFELLGNISSNVDHYEFLKTCDSLTHYKHAKRMRLMNETIE